MIDASQAKTDLLLLALQVLVVAIDAYIKRGAFLDRHDDGIHRAY